MKSKKPLTISVDKSCIEDFRRLLKKDSPLKSKETKDVFLLAVAKGYSFKSRVKLKNKESFVRTEYLKDEDEALLKAIAISETKDWKILSDPKEIFAIAEEYAVGGIKHLKHEVFDKQYGSFLKRVESQLFDKAKKLSKNK